MLAPAEAWGDAFALAYQARSLRNRTRQERRREADARRREARAGERPPSPERAMLGELARERFRSRQALVRLRLAEGFRWQGGAVAGDPAYWRAPFTFRGLASDGHPVLKHFVTKLRRAHALTAGDNKAQATGTDSKLLACDDPYIEANKAMRGVLRVEVDRIFAGGFVELVEDIIACGAPMPNLVVGHLDAAGRLHHPHLLWLLADSVTFTDKGRKAPRGLYEHVLAGLTAKLLPLGADPGGTANAMRMKNPLSPLWERLVLADAPYSLAPDTREGAPGLAALAPQLDLAGAAARLRAASEACRHRPILADHPDPAIAGQSNALFRHLCELARRRVGWHREHGSEGEFRQELAAEALRIAPAGRGGERAATATAASVAKGTWAYYCNRPVRLRCASPGERQERQAEAARATAQAKRGGTLAAIAEAIQRLSAAGRPATQAAVAEASGRGERTVRRHWTAALAAAAEPAISSAIDKKGPALPGGAAPAAGAIPEVPEVHGPPQLRAPAYGGRAAETAGGPSGTLGGGWPGPLRQLPRPASPAPLSHDGTAQRCAGGAGFKPAGGARSPPSTAAKLADVLPAEAPERAISAGERAVLRPSAGHRRLAVAWEVRCPTSLTLRGLMAAASRPSRMPSRKS